MFHQPFKYLTGGVNNEMSSSDAGWSLSVVVPDVAVEQKKGWDVLFRPAVVGNVTITSDEVVASLWH